MYREMLKKYSSQEPLGQFQTNLHAWGMGIQIVQIKGLNKWQNKENFDKSSKIFFS